MNAFVCSSWSQRNFSTTSWIVFLSFQPPAFPHGRRMVRRSLWPRFAPVQQRSCHHVRPRRPWLACATSSTSVDTSKRALLSRGRPRHGWLHPSFSRPVRVRKGNLDREKGPRKGREPGSIGWTTSDDQRENNRRETSSRSRPVRHTSHTNVAGDGDGLEEEAEGCVDEGRIGKHVGGGRQYGVADAETRRRTDQMHSCVCSI